jgi:hypothetical protein
MASLELLVLLNNKLKKTFEKSHVVVPLNAFKYLRRKVEVKASGSLQPLTLSLPILLCMEVRPVGLHVPGECAAPRLLSAAPGGPRLLSAAPGGPLLLSAAPGGPLLFSAAPGGPLLLHITPHKGSVNLEIFGIGEYT